MFSMPDRAQRTIFRWQFAMAAVTLLLSVLVHFSADLTWLSLTTSLDRGQSVAVPPAANADRTSLADPNGAEAILPQVWSIPGSSPIAMIWTPIPRDRAQTHPPLLQPPAGRPTI
jgi:hypothetical protein